MHHLKSYQLAVRFYRIAKGVELPGHLKDQLRRAASSVALNLGEGSGKRTGADRGRFFTHSDGLYPRVSGNHGA